MIRELTTFNWISILAALLVYIGPGLGLYHFYPRSQGPSTNLKAALIVGFSFSFWSILLVWLHLFGIQIHAFSVIFLSAICWIAVLIPGLRRIKLHPPNLRQGLLGGILWLIIFIVLIAGTWGARDTVAGLGSDSYHHTLFTQLIADRGILPDNLLPTTPIASFRYHFGFHGFAAIIAMISGIEPRILVPILGYVLNALSILAIAFFTFASTQNKLTSTLSAFVAGFGIVFPIYMLNWGRFTQLNGLVLLPIFVGVYWTWRESNYPKKQLPFISILAIGLALTHYRVTMMGALAASLIYLLQLFGKKDRIDFLKHSLKRNLSAIALALVLASPWIIHLLAQQNIGFPINTTQPDISYFSLDRLGPDVMQYPTNIYIVSFSVLAAVIGILKRSRVVIFISTWTLLMVLLSLPPLTGSLMDTVSIAISLFFPAALLIGWLLSIIFQWIMLKHKSLLALAMIPLLFLSTWGVISLSSITDPGAAYVLPEDLIAMQWIKANTPESAYFMVNTFHFGFSPDLVIGSDAGYWLPLLSGRRTVTSPMTYGIERATIPDFIERLTGFDKLEGRLSSSEAVSLMENEGVTHVYIGQKNGSISAENLQLSPKFELQYRDSSVYIFKFNPK